MVNNLKNEINKVEREIDEDMNLNSSTKNIDTSGEKELNEMSKNIEQALWGAQRLEKFLTKDHKINVEEEIKYD